MLQAIVIAVLALVNANDHQPWSLGGPADFKITQGKVVEVTNGDTIKILSHQKVHRVRLLYVAAPDLTQPFGEKAKRALSKKILGKKVQVAWIKKDKYNRILGEVSLGKRFINGEMIRDGFAWHYKKHAKSKRIASLEAEAKNAKRGLWVDENPVPPWKFRHKNGQSK